MYVFSSEKQFISATFFIILKLTLECVPLCFLLHLPRSLSNSTSGWVMFPDTCASRCLCPTSCGSTASAWPTGLLWKGKKVIKRLFSVEGMCAARHHSGEVTAKAFFFCHLLWIIVQTFFCAFPVFFSFCIRKNRIKWICQSIFDEKTILCCAFVVYCFLFCNLY